MGQSEKMEQEDNRPKWLMELENRKRKPRLAHEVGAGSACMTCSTACPGLDLHFWRKICKNCKCSRDDHDVPNDEFPQFDLLFGPTGKPNRKSIVLKVNKKQAEAEITFEWAPPNTTKELAADYMKALPEEKLPIKGTAGAVLRKQQLQRQLPIHDIDHKVCDELTESERKQFEKYLENLKKYVGQGKVIKAMGARPFDISLMTPANATDMNRFSPNHKPNPTETVHTLNLRTPSSFVQKKSFSSPQKFAELTNGPIDRATSRRSRDSSPTTATRFERVLSPFPGNSFHENRPQGRYHRVLENVRNNGETLSSEPVVGSRNSPLNLANNEKMIENDRRSTKDPKNSIVSPLESSCDDKNTNVVNSDAVGGTYNPASKFVCPKKNVNGGKSFVSTNLEENVNSRTMDGGSNCVDRNFTSDRGYLDPTENLAISNSVTAARSPGFAVPLKNNRRPLESETIENCESMKIREEENSSLAEKMLDDALRPPSSVNVADIVGSTLDKKGLSFIREKLTSKYRSKEEPAMVQNASRSRDLTSSDAEEAKLRRNDRFRRQRAFDRDPEKMEIVGSTKNPSETIMTDETTNDRLRREFPSSSGMDKDRETRNIVGEKIHRDDSNFPNDRINESDAKNISAIDENENTGNEPWRRIIRGICDDYLTKPENLENVGSRRDDDQRKFENSSDHGSNGSTLHGESRPAQLISYGPENSNLIRSESLNNPVFPEEPIFSSGTVENPMVVDRLRGAMEELSVGQTKIQNCHHCRENVRPGDVVVTAERANDAVWHPGCFVCSECNELLADLVYFYYKGKLYCGRDLATLLEIPRCFACDELIFVREYTVAEGHNYHVKHFCCWDCDVPLAGQQYISENDRPLCLPCYQKTYAQTCRTCEGVIAADQQGVAVKNLNFHATDRCFCCATCKKSLLNGQMAIKEDRPFCSKECIAKFLNERSI